MKRKLTLRKETVRALQGNPGHIKKLNTPRMELVEGGHPIIFFVYSWATLTNTAMCPVFRFGGRRMLEEFQEWTDNPWGESYEPSVWMSRPCI